MKTLAFKYYGHSDWGIDRDGTLAVNPGTSFRPLGNESDIILYRGDCIGVLYFERGETATQWLAVREWPNQEELKAALPSPTPYKHRALNHKGASDIREFLRANSCCRARPAQKWLRGFYCGQPVWRAYTIYCNGATFYYMNDESGVLRDTIPQHGNYAGYIENIQ